MIFFSHYNQSSLSWILQSMRLKHSVMITNNQEFNEIIKTLHLDRVLYSTEEFYISKANVKMEKSKFWLTTVNYIYYKKLMNRFGNILFDNEMSKCGIIKFRFEKIFDSLKIFWIIQNDAINEMEGNEKSSLIFKKLFDKHFPELKNETVHLSLDYSISFSPIEKRKSIEMNENVLNSLENHLENTFRIYNKRKNPYHYRVFLICLPTTLNKNDIFNFNKNQFNSDSLYEEYLRFGIYQGKKLPLKTFTFYQLKTDSENDHDHAHGNKQMSHFKIGDTRFIITQPPNNIVDMTTFSLFMFNIVISHC